MRRSWRPARTRASPADRLLAAIEASKRAELWRFIHGLGIAQVGAVTAREVARRFGSLDALLRAAPGEFGGDATGRALAGFFAEPRNRALVEGLLAAGVRPSAPAGAATGAAGRRLAGKIFVLTGTLPTLTRTQATEKIEAAGGKVAGSVSRNTHYLLAGADPGGKREQARTLGVTVLDEAAFLALLREE